jgi:hypothetical protein
MDLRGFAPLALVRKPFDVERGIDALRRLLGHAAVRPTME